MSDSRTRLRPPFLISTLVAYEKFISTLQSYPHNLDSTTPCRSDFRKISDNGRLFKSVRRHQNCFSTIMTAIDDNSIQRNQDLTPVLRLPAELRNQIYKCALSSATATVHRYTLSNHHRYHITRDSRSLFATCRQLRFEAAPYRDQVTTLVFTRRITLCEVRNQMGDSRCSRIHTLVLPWACLKPSWWANLLRARGYVGTRR